jgi:hypothetical protein
MSGGKRKLNQPGLFLSNKKHRNEEAPSLLLRLPERKNLSRYNVSFFNSIRVLRLDVHLCSTGAIVFSDHDLEEEGKLATTLLLRSEEKKEFLRYIVFIFIADLLGFFDLMSIHAIAEPSCIATFQTKTQKKKVNYRPILTWFVSG